MLKNKKSCTICGTIGAQTILMSESEKKYLKRTGKSFDSLFPALKQQLKERDDKKKSEEVKETTEFRMYECKNPDCLKKKKKSKSNNEPKPHKWNDTKPIHV